MTKIFDVPDHIRDILAGHMGWGWIRSIYKPQDENPNWRVMEVTQSFDEHRMRRIAHDFAYTYNIKYTSEDGLFAKIYFIPLEVLPPHKNPCYTHCKVCSRRVLLDIQGKVKPHTLEDTMTFCKGGSHYPTQHPFHNGVFADSQMYYKLFLGLPIDFMFDEMTIDFDDDKYAFRLQFDGYKSSPTPLAYQKKGKFFRRVEIFVVYDVMRKIHWRTEPSLINWIIRELNEQYRNATFEEIK